MTSSPPMTSQTTGEVPRSCGCPGLAFTKPQVPDCRTPNTSRDSPTIDNSAPITSNRTRPAGGASLTLRSAAKMTATITTSPTKTHRHDANVVTAPPMSGPAATAIAPAAAIIP